jgi:hypothetical protein
MIGLFLIKNITHKKPIKVMNKKACVIATLTSNWAFNQARVC